MLSPAHQWLFSPFDAAIGHCRRYTKSSLRAVGAAVDEFRTKRLSYLDSCGLFASAGNRLLLRQAMPTLQQILFWIASWSRVPACLTGFFSTILASPFSVFG